MSDPKPYIAAKKMPRPQAKMPTDSGTPPRSSTPGPPSESSGAPPPLESSGAPPPLVMGEGKVRLAGCDARGWKIIEVAPHLGEDEPRMIKVDIQGKQSLVVSQRTVLKVHINPSKDSFDEWNGLSVLSPLPADLRDAVSTASDADFTPLVEMVLGGVDEDRPDRHYILPPTAQVRIIRKRDNADAGPETKRVRVR